MNYLDIKNRVDFKNQLCLKISILIVLISAISILIIHPTFEKFLFKNLSPSAPFGIYAMSINQKLSYDDYTIVSLPIDMPSLNVKKGFPLLKKIEGFPGDHYTITKNALFINGRSYKIYHRKDLPCLRPGNYIVPPGKFLFLNDPDISFDSRYLGPINSRNIIKKVFLLIPFSM